MGKPSRHTSPFFVPPLIVPTLVALTAGFVVLPTTAAPAIEPRPVAPTLHSFALRGTPWATEAPQAAPLTQHSAAPSTPGAGATPEHPPASERTPVPDADRDLVAATPAHRTEPFTLVGVTWESGTAPARVTVRVRVRESGTWGDWQSLPVPKDEGPDADTPEGRRPGPRSGTEPLLTAGATGVQIRVTSPTGVAPRDLRADLVDAGSSPADRTSPARPAGIATAAAATAPTVITRRQWGAQESLRRGSPVHSPQVRALVLHHTASRNGYSRGEVFGMIRGIYAYHTKDLGWDDIGYNFLVDQFGRTFEGRAGSITDPVVGAHAVGFNTGTLGVSVIGDHRSVQPTSDSLTAVKRLMAWKAGQYRIAPTGTTTLTAGVSGRWPRGTRLTRSTILGHLDVGSTACPGSQLYTALPGIRRGVAARLGSGGGVEPDGGPTRGSRAPSAFVVTGSGFGHGVGVSQYGAQAQALSGRGTRKILSSYYTGTTVRAVRDTGAIRVQVLGGAGSARITSTSLAGRAGGRFRATIGGRTLRGTARDTLTVTPVRSGLRAVLHRASGSTTSRSGARLVVTWQGTQHLSGGATVMDVAGAGGRYRHGRLELKKINGRVNVVARMRLHDEYLNGVDEVPSGWRSAALRALVVAARTNAVRAMARGVRPGCDCHLTDGIADQRFTGWTKEHERSGKTVVGARWVAAVRGSAPTSSTGYVVTYRGSPIEALYFSSSAGRTEASEDVWSSALPYARSVADPWSKTSINPYRSWKRTVTQRAMANAFGLSDVNSLKVTRRTKGGAVGTVTATSTGGRTKRLTGHQLRSRLGLRSAWFTVR